MEHIKTNDTVYFTANFYHPTSGFSYAADSLPTWRVYKDNATTAMSGNVMTARTDIAGSYFGSFGATLNNGFITNSFYDVQVSGSVSGLSAFTSVKQFVLNDIFDANIVQVSGEAFGIMVGSIDANIVKVSGESVSIADFGGGTGASASELWGYANRSLTTAVSVSGIPQVNLIQVSGAAITPTTLPKVNVIQVSGVNTHTIPTIKQIAGGVLDESVLSHTALTTLGKTVIDILYDTAETQETLAASGRLDSWLNAISGDIQTIATDTWSYATRSLTNAVSVSGIPQVNVIQVSGEYVNIGSFGGGDGGSLTAQAVRAELDANSVMLASISGNMVTQQQVYAQASGALINYDVVNYNDLLARSLAAADYFDFTTDTVMANMIEINGVAASGTGTVNANIVQVSGEYVNIGSFGGGAGASAAEVWTYGSRELTAAVSVSGIPQVNLVQVSGATITPTVLPKVNMVQVSGQFVNTNSFQTTAANIRTAVGLNTASLNTQLVNISGYVDCLPVSWITPLDSGGLRGAIGLSSANLDSQLTGLSGDLVTANTAVYFANVKYVRDNINSQDEYSVVWFKNDQPVQSGSLTSPAISVFNTSTGAAVVNNQKMSYASPNLGVVRYNATSSLLGSGEPYLVGVSGVIDSTVRTWRAIVGIDAL